MCGKPLQTTLDGAIYAEEIRKATLEERIGKVKYDIISLSIRFGIWGIVTKRRFGLFKRLELNLI